MSKQEYNFEHKRLKERVIYSNRIQELLGKGPLSDKEKDWFNLQYARTNIVYASHSYRQGLVKTLKKSIARLEKDMTEEELKRVLGVIEVNSQ